MAKIEHKIITIKALPNHLDKNSEDAFMYFRIPKFQRGVVWDKERKLGLIDSVINEYPMGSLLLYGSSFSGEKQEVDVVDGLQRASTLAQFAQTPLVFLRPDQVFEESFLTDLDLDLAPNEDRSNPDFKRVSDTLLSSWFHEVKTISSREFSAAKLAKFIGLTHVEYGDAISVDFVDRLEAGLHDAKERVSKLFDYEIPAVLYKGPLVSVPEVFERINSLGKKLDKYEILASTWASEKVLIKNKQVRKKLEERYQGWLDMGWDVENYDPAKGISEDEANLHEYLLGLSQVLAETYPTLYRFQKDISDANIAFVIATYCFGLRNSDMARVSEVMPKSKGAIDPSSFESALFEVSAELARSLAALNLKLNKTTENSLALHSQNQIVSIVASCLVSSYDHSTWKLQNKALRDQICKSAPSHYIRDILDGAWSGSGDSRAFRLVWDEASMNHSASQRKKFATYYHAPVSRLDFSKVFENWNVEQLKKSQTDRPNTSKEAKIVLLIAYSSVVSFQSNAQIAFELEHLYPVKHIKSKIGSSGVGWPISAIGNLALLEKKHNRIKGEKLLGDYIPTLVNRKKNPIDQHEIDLINKYLICPDYSEIVDDPKLGLEEFKAFCLDRATAIRDLIAQNTHMK